MKIKDFHSLPNWLKSNVFCRSKIDNDYDSQAFENSHEEVHPLDANLITSRKANGRHVLMLDLDQPHFVRPSSTPGHGHVYIDADLETDALTEIVNVLAKHGILQPGIRKQLEVNGCLSFRPPGMNKSKKIDNVDLAEAKAMSESADIDTSHANEDFNKLKEMLNSGQPMSSDAYYDAFGKLESATKFKWYVYKEFLWDKLNKLFIMCGKSTEKISLFLPGVTPGELLYNGKKLASVAVVDSANDMYIFEFDSKSFQDWKEDGVPTWELVKKILDKGV